MEFILRRPGLFYLMRFTGGIREEVSMKRFLKVLVASVTSLCLVALNLPMTQGIVWADPEPKDRAIWEAPAGVNPTLQLTGNGPDERGVQLIYNEQQALSDSDLEDLHPYLAPCTLTLQLSKTEVDNTGVNTLQVTVDGSEKSDLVFTGIEEGTETITNTIELSNYYEVSYLKIYVNDDSNLIAELALKTVYKVSLSCNLQRNFDFFSGGQWCGQFVFSGEEATPLNAYLETKPDALMIGAPGGVGPDQYGRTLSVKLNGSDVPYDQESSYTYHFEDKDVTLDQGFTGRYGDIGISLSGVSGAISIEVTGDNVPGYHIGWVNSDGEIFGNVTENEKFQNGSAYLVSVKDKDGNVDPVYSRADGHVTADGNADVIIPAGSTVEFSLVPNVGYQLAELIGVPVQYEDSANVTNEDTVLGAEEAVNTYAFVMPQNNVHFQAKFDEASNTVVAAEGSGVSGGDIVIDPNEFEGGTAQLTVDSLAEEVIEEYENDEALQEVLGEDLEIDNYLQLDFANYYRKANDTSNNNFWLVDRHELVEGEASVELQLEGDNVPARKYVYIVHDLGDGVFDLREAEFDPDTNTVWFDTGSFSPFMIASSDVDLFPADDGGDDDGGDEELDDNIHLNIDCQDDEYVVITWEPDDEAEEEGDWSCRVIEQDEYFPEGTVIDLFWSVVEDKLTEKDFLIMVDGKTVATLAVAEDADKEYSFEQWVAFDSIEETDEVIEVRFVSLYVVAVDFNGDVEVKVLDADGKEMIPLNAPEGYPLIARGEDSEGPVELLFKTRPDSISVKGKDFAITEILYPGHGITTPTGENVVEYPEDAGNYFTVWGEGDAYEAGAVINLSTQVDEVKVTYAGLSEAEAKKYTLVIKNYEASEEYLAKVKEYLNTKGYNDVGFVLGLDILLYDQEGPVYEPGFDVTITVKLNKALNLKDGEKVYIYHPHGDSVEVLEGTYNAAEQTVTFTTRSFSPFIMFTASLIENAANTPTPTPASVPSTGETVGYTTLAGLALIAAAGFVFVRKKEMDLNCNNEEDAT